jgi:hypothetical protein
VLGAGEVSLEGVKRGSIHATHLTVELHLLSQNRPIVIVGFFGRVLMVPRRR